MRVDTRQKPVELAFAQIVCDDAELLRAELAAIVAASFDVGPPGEPSSTSGERLPLPTPTTPWPNHGAGTRTGVAGPQSLVTWARERSPPNLAGELTTR